MTLSKNVLLGVGALVIILTAGAGLFLFLNKTQPVSAPQPAAVIQRQPVVPNPPSTPTPSDKTAVNQIKLAITSPADNSQVSVQTITVGGQTVPQADVSVNGTDLKADASGNFATTVTLEEGDNPILVTASDDNGNYSEQEITIAYAP